MLNSILRVVKINNLWVIVGDSGDGGGYTVTVNSLVVYSYGA